jgi:flagellar motor switch protein FliM
VNEEIVQPLLSTEETNALLDLMRASVSPQLQVEGIDIGSPERWLRGALLTADRCARTVAKDFQKHAMRFSGYKLAAADQPSEIVPYKMLASTFARGSVAALLKIQEHGFGLVVVGPTLVSFLLERRLGSPAGDEPVTPVAQRSALSALDKRVIEPFTVSLAEVFFETWCHKPKSFKLERLIAETDDLPVIAEFEPLLQIRLRIESPVCAGDGIAIALSSTAVRDTLPRDQKETEVPINVTERMRLLSLIKEITLRAVVVFGAAESTIGEVLALKTGDIVRLDNSPDKPIDLRIEGTPIARGVPVVHFGNIALEILTTCQGGTP